MPACAVTKNSSLFPGTNAKSVELVAPGSTTEANSSSGTSGSTLPPAAPPLPPAPEPPAAFEPPESKGPPPAEAVDDCVCSSSQPSASRAHDRLSTSAPHLFSRAIPSVGSHISGGICKVWRLQSQRRCLLPRVCTDLYAGRMTRIAPTDASLTIRPFRDDDEPGLLRLWECCFPDNPPRSAPHVMLAQKRSMQPELLLVGL